LQLAALTGQVAALASRAVADVSLADPGSVASLLGALREAGATGQVATLASRAVADARLDNLPSSVNMLRAAAFLLEALREAGGSAQAAELVERLPRAGMFHLFYEQEGGGEDKFRFGREADGRPAKPWAWTDLG
jgi:hypothetical protein